MREFLIATRNKSKEAEIRSVLTHLPFQIITLNDTDMPRQYAVEELGNTYETNVTMKAVLYGKKADKLTLADDSGLEVDALNGWPGVHSADWKEGTDKERLNGLLERMKEVPNEKRTAQFRSTIAIFDPSVDIIRFVEGICRGRIIHEPKGPGGFGYDPIFFSDDLQKTFGEASEEDKNKVSHRARALQKARDILMSEFV